MIKERKQRKLKLTANEILSLPTKEMLPATIAQGFGTAKHKMVMSRVKRRVYFDSRDNFFKSMARNLKNNVETLQTHFKMTEAEFTQQVILKTSFSYSPRHGANYLLNDSYNYQDLHDMAFSIGFAFNISLDQMLNTNLEFIFEKGMAEGFEYYACEPYDIIHLSQ